MGKMSLSVLIAALACAVIFRFLAPPPEPEKTQTRTAAPRPMIAADPEKTMLPDTGGKTDIAPPTPAEPAALPLMRGAVAPAPILSRVLDSARFPDVVDGIKRRFSHPGLDARVSLISIDVVTLESVIRASQPFLSLANSDEADIGDPAQPDFALLVSSDLTLNLKILRAFEYSDFIQSLNASGTVVSELGDVGDWTLTMNAARDMISGTIRTDQRIYVFENTQTPSVRYIADLDRKQFEGTPPGG